MNQKSEPIGGNSFLLLILAIIAVMAVLGYFVLRQEKANVQPEEAAQNTENATERLNMDLADQKELLSIAKDTSNPETDRLEAILKFAEDANKRQDERELVLAMARLTLDEKQLVRIASGIVLNKIGADGAEHLKPMMDSANTIEVSMACTALNEMGGAKLFLPQMKALLESEEPGRRMQALFALQGSTDGILEVLDGVTNALTDAEMNVQGMACRALTKLGPEAIDAVEPVYRLYKEGVTPSARSLAATALSAIGPNTRIDTTEVLANNLNVFMYPEKQRILAGLALMGPEALAAADRVREAMRDEKRRVQPDAAYTLWRITGETEEPLVVLSAALDDPAFADVALELIDKMGPAAAPLVSKLAKQLESSEVELREQIVVALGNIGPAARDAMNALKKVAEDKEADPLIRYYAREAIRKIEKT